MRGQVAGGLPRIVPLGGDHEASVAGGAAWSIKVDQTVPGQVRISYTDMARFANTTDKFSFDCTLFASGAVRYSYGTTTPAFTGRMVGISIGNLVGSDASPSRDIGYANSGTEGMLFEEFTTTNPWDLNGKAVLFAPNGIGGYVSSVECAADHARFGSGCYSLQGTLYELFPDQPTAKARLDGNALHYAPTSNGYVALWIPGGAAGYIAPTGAATVLTMASNQNVAVTPSIPFPIPGGSAPTLRVSENGIVTCAAAANNGTSATPTGAALSGTAAPALGFYSWRDFTVNEVGSGQIKREEVLVGPDTVLCLTWDGVEVTPTTGSNPSTFQFQMNLTTGAVTNLWVSWDTSTSTSDALVGATLATQGATPASVNLATMPPTQLFPDTTALALSAAPAPTFPLGGSSVPMTWTISYLRDLSPVLPGAYVGMLVFSLNPPLFGTGIDLSLIGIDAPGCTLLVGSVDVTFSVSPVAPTHNVPLVFPQPLSPGNVFFSQAVNFLIPNSLPNGLNNFGLTISNGVRSRFDTF
jgi:hypothetical protein